MTPDAAVTALAELVKPPEQPARPKVIDWALFANANGFEAPEDYQLLMERYGVGGFGTANGLSGGWLYTLDPFEPTESLVALSEWDRRNSRGLQRRFPTQFPGWPMWPEKDGLLPWANSADGDLIGWWTAGEPDAWGTRYFGRDVDYEEFSFGAAEFILRLLTGQLGSAALDGRFSPLQPGEELRFFPIKVRAMHGLGIPHEDVTIVFAGLSPDVDQATLPTQADLSWEGDPQSSMARMQEYSRRWQAAMKPADDVIKAWAAAAKIEGFHLTGSGTQSAGAGDPLHHQVSGSFERAREDAAKRLVADLSARLGVAIVEVRNLENEPIWPDLTTRRLRLL